MGIRRGISLLLVVALVFPLFPVLSVNATEVDTIEGELSSVTDIVNEAGVTENIEDVPTAGIEPAEKTLPASPPSAEYSEIFENEGLTSSSLGKNEDVANQEETREIIKNDHIRSLRLYDAYDKSIDIFPEYSDNINQYNITCSSRIMRIYAEFPEEDILCIDDYNITAYNGILDEQIDLWDTCDINTSTATILICLVHADDMGIETIAQQIEITIELCINDDSNTIEEYDAEAPAALMLNSTWLAGATFTVKGPKQTDWTAAEFDPATTEYTVDIASTANSRTFTLTPTAAAVEAGVYFQFLLDDAPVISTLGKVVAPQQFTSTDTVKATKYTFDLAKVPVGTTHVVKLLVGPLTDGETNLKEADCNVYTFTVSRTVGINDLVVQDGEGNTATLNPAFHVQENRFKTEVSGSTIKIKTGWVNPTKVYVGNSTEPANSGTSNFAWTDVKLADYTAKDSDTAIIPIRVEYNDSGISSKRELQLSVKWKTSSEGYIPIIESQSRDVVCDKGENIELFVKVKPNQNGGTVSYQWYLMHSYSKPDEVWESAKLDGQTNATIKLITNEAEDRLWYCCKITNKTSDGGEYSTYSDLIHVEVRLNYVNQPIIQYQPGTIVLKNHAEFEEGTYKTEYYAGEQCDPIYTRLKAAERGSTYSFSWFYNTQNSTLGGREIPSVFYKSSNGCYGYRLNKSFEEGTYYIYCVVRATDDKNEENYAETVSDTCKLVFHSLNASDFEGKGIETSPYLLKTQEDLRLLQKRVNEEGASYAGAYFAFANDITLPDNWTPIGCIKDGSMDIQKGLNLNAFSGIIDGKNHLLTVPSGSLPLLGYVNGATVRNLNIYGTQIAGAGLVNNYTGPDLSGNAVTIENVRLKSGTQTLNSGLVRSVFGGNTYASASAGFTVTIRNCVAEDGVTIGYTGKESKIGTFADRINGTIENCTSNATVKGKNYVGGLIGTMDNAMGKCIIRNSEFHGTVISSGSFAGGIIGGGYSNDNSAPNGGRPSVIGCKVDGTVNGNRCVGGITGGDQYVAQTRNNATHSITGNTFTGTISGSEYIGGIIGYYNSLNKYDNVAGNFYSGADLGIGYVKYIDTGYENPKLMNGTIAFNTGKTTTGLPDIEWNTWKAGLNRTDDPLGVNADALASKIGGEVKPVCTELNVSGTYKTQYTVGDELNLTGIKLTAKWSDGSTSKVDLKDVTVEGYDKNNADKQTITLSYGAAKAYITVTVAPKSTKIMVSVSILGDSKHGTTSTLHGLARGGLTSWVNVSGVEADTSETVWDVLQRVGQKHGITFNAGSDNAYGTVYIKAVNDLGEFDNGKNSGWMYTVNGTHPDRGVAARFVQNGDKIVLHYTDDYTYEEGGDNYNKPAEDTGTAQKVIDLINKIGTVTYTDACKQRIDAARSAYDALTATEKSKVGTNNLATLTKAEAEYKRLMQAGATDVDNLISKIGTVTANSGPAISNAWNAYNALTAEQKALVKKFNTLQEATQKWNQLKADEVVKLIDKIEEPVTEKSKASIEAARKAFDGLTDAQKRLVTNTKKLTDAEKAYAQLTATPEDKEKAQKVIDLIKKLTNVTLDSEKDIQAARKAYDALTDLQKPLVDNYDVLTTAETKLAMLKAMGKVSDPYISTGDYMEKLGTPGIGSIGGEWMVIGLARSGRTVPGVEDYYKKALEYIESSIDPETGRLHKAKSTDNSRMILALTALGRDVTNVGGYNLLQGLSDLEYVKYQGNNGPIWALLALDCGNYPVPSGGIVTRQALIDEILRVQTSDGGWTVSGDKADSDMTGMALTALAPYYTKDLKVQEAIDKAIARLSEMQDEDGGYSTSYDGTTKIATSESISQVVTALSALGINADTDPRFVKNGNSVIDALLRYYVKGGGFKHVMNGEIDGMGTEQAYYALTAYYRFLSGKTNLYDMTDIIDMGGDVVTVEPTVPAATEPAQAANIPWWIIAVCIFGGAGWGVVIGIVLVPKLNKKKD